MRNSGRAGGVRVAMLALALFAADVRASLAAEAGRSVAYRLEGDALAVIDPVALVVVDRIPLLAGARELAVSPDGGRAYAVGWDRLQVIDLRARLVRDVVPVATEDGWLLRVAPGGGRLCLVESGSYGNAIELYVLDADAAVERRLSLPLPAQAWSAFVAGFAFDAGGDRAWVLISADADAGRQLWIYAADLATGGVVAQVRAPQAGATYFGAAAIDPARGVAFVATDDGARDEVRMVELATGAVLARVSLPAGALPFWDAARERLFAWTYAIEPTTEREETALFALDPERARARRLATFAGWPQALLLAPDGTWWVGLGEPSPRTVLVDSDSGGVLGEIAAAGGIGGQAFAPGLPDHPPPPRPSPTPAAAQSYRAVVLSSGAHTVTEIDTGSAATVSVRIAHELHDAIPIGASADAEALYGITNDTVLTYQVGSGETFARRFANATAQHVLQRGVAMPDGSRVFVGTWASVGEVDLHRARASDGLGFGGDDVDALALAAAGQRLLVATDGLVYDTRRGTLHVVDPATWRDLATVGFPGRAVDLAEGADGRAWIATGEAVVAVDLSTAEIAAIIPIAARSIAVAADGERVYVATGDPWQGVPPTLTAIDTSSLRVAGAAVVAGAGAAADLALTPDGQRALLAIDGTPARVAVVDLGRLETVGMVRVGTGPRAVAIAAEPWTPPPSPPPSSLPRRPAGDLHPCMLVPLGAGEESPSGAIALLDPTRHGVAGLIPVGESSPDGGDAILYDGVSAVVADPDGTRLYATVPSHRGGAGYLAAVDPTTGAVIGRLPVGIDPWSVSLTADGRRALVANWNGYLAPPSLSIVDLDGWRVLDEVALPEGARGIHPSADGQLLYVRTQQRQYVDGRDVYDDRLVAIDPRSGAVAFAIPLSVSHEPAGGVAVLPDGRTLLAEIGTDDGYYTPEPEIVAVLDLETRATVARIEIPFTSWNSRAYGSATFAVSPDGGEVYRSTGANPGTATVLDPVARRLLAQIPVEHGFGPPAFTADGAFVFGNSGVGVAVIDTATRRLAAEVPLGGWPGSVVAAMLDAPCEATPAATPTPDPAPTSPTAAPPWPPTPTWSGAWVDLRIGSASGAPGTTVAVDVRLDGAVSVAGTQLGIAYEPPLAIAATAQGRPACRAHAEAGKPSAFAFWPVGCRGAECRAVRALTLALDDVAPIADGARLFSCDVAIAADAAAGSYALRAVEVGASDPDGNALPARGQSGAVRVGPAPHGGAAVRETSAGNASGCAIAGPAGDGDGWLFAGIVSLLALRWIALRCTTDRA